jgi:hypothetical protein
MDLAAQMRASGLEAMQIAAAVAGYRDSMQAVAEHGALSRF